MVGRPGFAEGGAVEPESAAKAVSEVQAVCSGPSGITERQISTAETPSKDQENTQSREHRGTCIRSRGRGQRRTASTTAWDEREVQQNMVSPAAST